MRTALLVTLLWAACAAGDGAAQLQQDAQPVAAIQYRPDGNLMLLPVGIGGQTEWFVFDSGASHSVLDPRLVARLGLRSRGRGTTTGTGTGSIGLEHGEPVTLQVGPISIRSEDPWIIDLSGVPIQPDVRGLIGSELWKRFVLRIDPGTRTISLFEPAAFRPQEGETAVPLIVEGDKMYVDVRIDVRPGLSVTHRLRVDTGANDTVNDPIVGQAAETRVTTLGQGLGQDYQAVSGRLDAVHLGPYTIRHVWGPGGNPPSIGMELLRRFVVTFDAPHGRLYLRPTAALADPVPPPPGG